MHKRQAFCLHLPIHKYIGLFGVNISNHLHAVFTLGPAGHQHLPGFPAQMSGPDHQAHPGLLEITQLPARAIHRPGQPETKLQGELPPSLPGNLVLEGDGSVGARVNQLEPVAVEGKSFRIQAGRMIFIMPATLVHLPAGEHHGAFFRPAIGARRQKRVLQEVAGRQLANERLRCDRFKEKRRQPIPLILRTVIDRRIGIPLGIDTRANRRDTATVPQQGNIKEWIGPGFLKRGDPIAHAGLQRQRLL